MIGLFWASAFASVKWRGSSLGTDWWWCLALVMGFSCAQAECRAQMGVPEGRRFIVKSQLLCDP